MRLQIVAGALALAGSSVAFSDSSPWVLLSTSKFPEIPNNQFQTSSQVLKTTKDILASCPTDNYLLVSQPGLNAADLDGPNGCAIPSLCQPVQQTGVNGKFVVSEVVGETSKIELDHYIRDACSRGGKRVKIDQISLPPLTSDRASVLAESNSVLSEHFETLTSGGSYTLLFIGTPGEPIYEPDFVEPVRMDLKRHLQGQLLRRDENETERDTRPLFEKYQFFTPGIFVAIITAIILFTILGVGLSALSSLEVSYGAFEKDMGPAAQKKQQ